MGKYIWPHNLADAAYWYLHLLHQIGKGMSLGELLVAIMNDPHFGERPSRRQVQRQLYQLQSSGLVDKNGSYNKATYCISQTGIERLEQLSLLGYRQIKFTSWDGRWRLVMYDIPETLREARYHIRRLLKELGFKQLQLSVWIHPLPYLEAFQKIQSAYGIESHLLLLEVADYNPTKVIVEHFQKKYPGLINNVR